MSEKRTGSKGGRPKKYEFEHLKTLLYDYIQKENPPKITVTGLVKYTGIPIQAWRFNKEIKQEIELLNEKLYDLTTIAPIRDVKELLNIPSAEEMVNKSYGNKSKLTGMISTLLEAYQYSLVKSLKVDEFEKENGTLKKQISTLKEEVNFYKEEMKKMAIKSTSLVERTESNIKENVIDIKHYSETNKTFKDLFDD